MPRHCTGVAPISPGLVLLDVVDISRHVNCAAAHFAVARRVDELEIACLRGRKRRTQHQSKAQIQLQSTAYAVH
jgi:hypothetical protein